MRFYGFYNFKGGGTEQITGIANAGLPSSEDTISQNNNILFNGEFSNLSRDLVHVGLVAFKSDGATSLHKHDLRPYESIILRNVPLQKVLIYVASGQTVGFHGMGVLTLVENEDERAVALTKSSINEALHNSPNFDTDVYKNTTITTATTTTLWTPATNTAIGLYKVTMACAGAQTVELRWTNTAGTGGVNVIGLYRFGAEGTFVMDFDTAMLRNPNGQNGLLRAVTTTTGSTQIDCIGHDIQVSQ